MLLIGLAPCLSSSIAQLMKYWIIALKEEKISGLQFRMYIGGYKGILTGDSFIVPESEWAACEHLNNFGGSPIGNSRVKVSTKLHPFNCYEIIDYIFECQIYSIQFLKYL